jgi:hypothetical protein
VSTGPSELAGFHQFIGERLKQGHVNLSPEEALDLWRTEHPDPDEFEETVQALREAIEDLESGVPTRPFEEFDREFRQRHNIPDAP